MNADKTHLLITGTNQRLRRINTREKIDISMDGFKLKESEDKSEYLIGIHVQSDMKWSKQIDVLKSKLKDRLTGLSKVRNIVSSLKLRKTIAEGEVSCSNSKSFKTWLRNMFSEYHAGPVKKRCFRV